MNSRHSLVTFLKGKNYKVKWKMFTAGYLFYTPLQGSVLHYSEPAGKLRLSLTLFRISKYLAGASNSAL